MSGLIKGVVKVFKKVGEFVKKHWKKIAIAAAIYFTAGVAMSYFGSTAAFASSLPGFGTGEIFARAAIALGFQGSAGVASGLSMTSGVWAGEAGAAMGTVLAETGTATATAGAGGGLVSQGGGGPLTAQVGKDLAGKTIAGNVIAGGTATTEATALETALIKSLAWQKKLGIAQLGLKMVSGALAPDPDELDENAVARRNQAAFGVGRSGDATYGFGSQNYGGAFTNMNKRVGPPPAGQPSQFTPQSGAGNQMASSQFLGAPFQPAQAPTMNPLEELQNNDFIEQGYERGSYLPA